MKLSEVTGIEKAFLIGIAATLAVIFLVEQAQGAEIKCEEKQIEAWDRKAKEYVVINQVDCGHMTYMYPAAAEPAWAYDPETGKDTMIWVLDEETPDGN